jgi:hypothetical protein
MHPRILPGVIIPIVQKRHIYATPARSLATLGSRPMNDQTQTPRPKMKWGVDSDMLYIGGGLAAIGGIWYYYATMENARIEKRRERSDPTATSASAGTASQPAKGRT